MGERDLWGTMPEEHSRICAGKTLLPDIDKLFPLTLEVCMILYEPYLEETVFLRLKKRNREVKKLTF